MQIHQVSGTATLPDGRRIKVFETGYHEPDTNAFVQVDLELVWAETGEELTADEYNAEIFVGEEKCFLHEYCTEKTEWD